MNLRLVAHAGKGVPTPEEEAREGNFIDLTDPTQTLSEAITELQVKVPGTDVSKLFFMVSGPQTSSKGKLRRELLVNNNMSA